MNLTPNSILERAPNLKVQILNHGEIIIFMHDRWVKCISHGLAILDAFAQPIVVSEAVRKLGTRFADPKDRAQAIDLISDLYRAGFLQNESRRNEVRQPLYPKPTFECFLYERPPVLLPYSGRSSGPVVDRNAVVINKRIQIQMVGEPPVGSTDMFPHCARFLSGYPLLWVQHPGTKVLTPYWLNTTYLKLIQGLIAGEISPSELDPAVFSTLIRANVLVPADYEESQARAWQETFADLFMQLQSQQYAIVRSIIHPLQIAALRKYFRTLDHKNFLIADLQGGSVRYALHNEEVAQFIQHQLSKLMICVTQELVKPSYSFLSIYKSGSFLAKHSDRPQCAWNLSLLIDTDPERELSDSWPISLEVSSRTKEIRLEMGDGLLYRGTEIPHWREALGNGETTTLILCHFVPEDFEGDLD